MVKLGLPSLRSTVPRQTPMSQCPLVELGRRGPEQRAGVAPARFAGEARPPGIAKQRATTESDIAGSSDDARPPGTDKQGATTESDIAVSLGEAGPSRPRAIGRNSAGSTAVAMPAGEARHLGIAKQSATTKPEFAESSGGAGSHGSKVGGMTNAAVAAAVANSADEGRPPGVAKHSATTVESFGEDSSSDKVERLLYSLRDAGLERAMRSLEKLREKRDLLAWMVKGLAELFSGFSFLIVVTEPRRLRLKTWSKEKQSRWHSHQHGREQRCVHHGPVGVSRWKLVLFSAGKARTVSGSCVTNKPPRPKTKCSSESEENCAEQDLNGLEEGDDATIDEEGEGVEGEGEAGTVDLRVRAGPRTWAEVALITTCQRKGVKTCR